MDKKQEIERKFWIRRPDHNALLAMATAGVPIMQGYLPLSVESRIRKAGDHFWFTIKGEGDLARDEWEPEEELPEGIFWGLWPDTAGNRVEKTRHTIACLGTKKGALELDIYQGVPEFLAEVFRGPSLIIIESEFESEPQAQMFRLPEWVGQMYPLDVTGNSRFKNKNLAKCRWCRQG